MQTVSLNEYTLTNILIDFEKRYRNIRDFHTNECSYQGESHWYDFCCDYRWVHDDLPEFCDSCGKCSHRIQIPVHGELKVYTSHARGRDLGESIYVHPDEYKRFKLMEKVGYR